MKILFISYYFPPCGPGWAMRTVNFIRHFGQLGWKNTVLTVKEKYYKENLTVDHGETLPEELAEVVRTDSWEPSRPLNSPEATADIRASAPENTRGKRKSMGVKAGLVLKATELIERFLLIPDVKILWFPQAFRTGKKLIREKDPDLLFASLPVFSSGIIGWALKKATGKPLVIDFRDDWAENPAYRHPYAWGRRLNSWYERKVVEAADLVILVTGWSVSEFTRRYPNQKAYLFLPNGYDPRLEKIKKRKKPSARLKKLRLVHSGYVALERDPSSFFEAAAQWLKEDPGLTERFSVIFVGSVERRYLEMAGQLGLDDLFEFTGSLPYEENIRYLAGADAFLLLPSHNAPHSIPGKLYEYLYLGKPILAVSLPNASVDLLKEWNWGSVADPGDKKEIRDRLEELLKRMERPGPEQRPDDRLIRSYSRADQANRLAGRLKELRQ
ncbi:MAG: glycosyltransferase family 4 protein [bacterium]